MHDAKPLGTATRSGRWIPPVWCQLVVALALAWWPTAVVACPFCSATQQTLSEEIAAAEVSVIARLVHAAPAAEEGADFDPTEFDPLDTEAGLATFRVEKVLRGAQHAGELETIKVVYFGSGEGSPQRFLIHAQTFAGLAPQEEPTPSPPPSMDWTTPLPLSPRGVDYVLRLPTLPAKGAERLVYFQRYFEDADPLLAQDAYDEFARAPYAEVMALADHMDREQLLTWIEDPQVGPTRRRLYLTMLGVCGQAADAQRLESLLLYDYQLLQPGVAVLLATWGQTGPAVGTALVDELLRADVRRQRQCLDALIAAYLKLRGADGLPLIENKFLKNPAVEYSHLYAALMALRFHGEETDVLPRPQLLAAIRLLLDNPEIADQVVPDLARWEDWSVLNKLVALFRESAPDGWIRQPVVSYLLHAAEQPGAVGPRAQAALVELESIDPACVQRTRKYMAFGLFARGLTQSAAEPSTASSPPQAGTAQPEPSRTAPQQAPETPADMSSVPQSPDNNGAPPEAPGPLVLIGIPIIAGVLLLGILALLLRGADVRATQEPLAASHDTPDQRNPPQQP